VQRRTGELGRTFSADRLVCRTVIAFDAEVLGRSINVSRSFNFNSEASAHAEFRALLLSLFSCLIIF
jgi:hypothetical protein